MESYIFIAIVIFIFLTLGIWDISANTKDVVNELKRLNWEISEMINTKNKGE